MRGKIFCEEVKFPKSQFFTAQPVFKIQIKIEIIGNIKSNHDMKETEENK